MTTEIGAHLQPVPRTVIVGRVSSPEPREPPRRQPVEKLAYRIPEAVAATGIGRSTLYEMIKAGHLKTKKVRGMTLITRTELERLLEDSPPGDLEG